MRRGTRCPAIVEFLPYRRRDGTMLADSKMYPWWSKENFQLLVDDPLSMTGVTRSAATLERPATGWRIRTETSTWVWSEREKSGEPVFR